jgi:hypothetical protein
MNSAGVITDHAAQGAAIVSGGIWSEGQVVLFGCGTKVIEDDAGLYAGDAEGRIDFENLRHVPGKIKYDCNVAALTREGRACAAAE